MVKVRGTGEHRMEALRLADAFRARVIDATTESFVFEITGASEKIESFINLMLPVGLVEVSRTGVVAIARGPGGDVGGQRSYWDIHCISNEVVMKVKVAKWGNSLGLRLPKAAVEAIGIENGAELELVVEGRDLRLRRIWPIPYYRMEDLIAEMKRLGPEN